MQAVQEFSQTLPVLLFKEAVVAVVAVLALLLLLPLAVQAVREVVAQEQQGLLLRQVLLELLTQAGVVAVQKTLQALAQQQADQGSLSFVCQAQSWLHSPAV